jgi:hypothetical protein
MRSTVVSRACWDSVATADVSGYALEAWMDTDNDDVNACRASLLDRVGCAPDSGEPQVLQEYTALARGETGVLVVLTDRGVAGRKLPNQPLQADAVVSLPLASAAERQGVRPLTMDAVRSTR